MVFKSFWKLARLVKFIRNILTGYHSVNTSPLSLAISTGGSVVSFQAFSHSEINWREKKRQSTETKMARMRRSCLLTASSMKIIFNPFELCFSSDLETEKMGVGCSEELREGCCGFCFFCLALEKPRIRSKQNTKIPELSHFPHNNVLQ